MFLKTKNKRFIFILIILIAPAVSSFPIVYNFDFEDYFFPLLLGIPLDRINEMIKLTQSKTGFSRKEVLNIAYDDPMILFQRERFGQPILKTTVKILGITESGKVRLVVQVKNSGNGDAFGVVSRVETSKNIDSPEKFIIYGFVPKHRTKSRFLDINIKGKIGWVKITTHEKEISFPPVKIIINKNLQRSVFQSENLTLEKFFVNEGHKGFAIGNGDGRVDPGELIEIIAILKNKSSKPLKNIVLLLSNRNKAVFVSKKISFINEIQPDETASATFSVITTPNYSEPVINFDLMLLKNEKQEKIGSIEITISFPLIVQSIFSSKINAKEKLTENLRDFKPNPRKSVALVVGIENYLNYPSSKFSSKDATDISFSLIRSLGLLPKNVKTLININASIEHIKNATERWLVKKSENYDEVFVFFSGYSSVDPKTRELYLIPWDGDIEYPKSTGYPLSKMLKTLGNNFSRVYVFLDTDIKSRTRTGKRILKRRTPLPVFPIKSGTSIFWLNGYDIAIKRTANGTLTNVFLKALQKNAKVDINNDKKLTLYELERFMAREVQKIRRKTGKFTMLKHTHLGKNIRREVIAEW